MSLAPVSLAAPDSGSVVPAIAAASRRTGVDFGYLLRQAEVESALNPQARAATSSAAGLYQFIEGTWLDMAERHGAKYGLTGGRADLLAARHDPHMASYMAAELAAENAAALETRWGGEVGATELYLAHFLGAGGAAEFLAARDAAPGRAAAGLLPEAAAANRAVFYDAGGRARSVTEVYDRFAAKFASADDSAPASPARSASASAPASAQTLAQADPDARGPAPTPVAQQRIVDPVAIMLMAMLEAPGGGEGEA